MDPSLSKSNANPDLFLRVCENLEKFGTKGFNDITLKKEQGILIPVASKKDPWIIQAFKRATGLRKSDQKIADYALKFFENPFHQKLITEKHRKIFENILHLNQEDPSFVGRCIKSFGKAAMVVTCSDSSQKTILKLVDSRKISLFQAYCQRWNFKDFLNFDLSEYSSHTVEAFLKCIEGNYEQIMEQNPADLFEIYLLADYLGSQEVKNKCYQSLEEREYSITRKELFSFLVNSPLRSDDPFMKLTCERFAKYYYDQERWSPDYTLVKDEFKSKIEKLHENHQEKELRARSKARAILSQKPQTIETVGEWSRYMNTKYTQRL